METVGVMLLETFNYNFYKKYMYYYNINSLSQKKKIAKLILPWKTMQPKNIVILGGGGEG